MNNIIKITKEIKPFKKRLVVDGDKSLSSDGLCLHLKQMENQNLIIF